MAIKPASELKSDKIEVDLRGPQGNAFALMGMASRWARELDMEDQWEAIQKDASSGDYEHLLTVLDKHFGDYVDFYR